MLAQSRVFVTAVTESARRNEKLDLRNERYPDMFSLRHYILSGTLILCANVATAQTPTWRHLVLRNAGARFAGTMAYDAARNNSVLFGGVGLSNLGPQNLDTTDIFDGRGWTEVTPVTTPPGRYATALTYDAANKVTVMYGGAEFLNNGINFLLSDTWTWDGTDWTQKNPVTVPPARYFSASAYDAARHQVVLFGGVDAEIFLGETWVWDGTNWTKKSPAHAPAPRMSAMMVYDAVHSQIVMFGGVNGNTVFGDTWTWDGSDWTQVFPATSPAARYGGAMVFDTKQGQTVLFAGTDTNGNFADTWTWNGTTWTQASPATSPEMRFFPSYAYDSGHNVFTIFAGGQGTDFGDIYLHDTWVWQ